MERNKIPEVFTNSLPLLDKSYNAQLITRNGEIVYANPSFCRLLDIQNCEDLVG